VADPADLLDEQVDCFGGAVGRAAGVEVRHNLGLPLGQRSARRATSGIGQERAAAMTAWVRALPVCGSGLM